MRTVRAKFKIDSVTKHQFGGQVRMSAVHSDDPNHENKVFTDYTPMGTIEIAIAKEDTLSFFVPGNEYYVDFNVTETE